MIIDWQKITDSSFPFGPDMFRGEIENSPDQTFTSLIPDVRELQEISLADPALAAQMGSSDFTSEFNGAFSSGLENKLKPMMNYIGELAMSDTIRGTRQTLGQMVQTTGITSANFPDVITIFQESTSDISKAFKVTDMVIGSDMFGKAMDGIGAIPVVGWIIKAIYEISKTVSDIVISNRDAKNEAAKRDLAKRLSIPLGSTQFEPSANDLTAKAFFRKIMDNKCQDIIRPAYHLTGNVNYGFEAGGVYKDEGDSMAAGWIVYGEASGNMGFVPGTSNMTRALFFPSGVKRYQNSHIKNCDPQDMRDMASLYPTAQNLCTGWWSQVNKPGASMFSVRPLAVRAEWEEYIERMYALAETLMSGWACAPTGTPFTDEFKCLSTELTGYGNKKKKGMGSCKHSERGKTMTIPGTFGVAGHWGFYAYLSRLYFGIKDIHNKSKGGVDQLPRVGPLSYTNHNGSKFYHHNAIDYSKSVPIESLNALYANQKATLESIQCMYVSGEDDDHGNRARFPAFYDSSLKSLWRASVIDVLASGTWDRVSFQDMPEGEAKTAFYQKAVSKGVEDVENFNRPCAPGEDPATSGCGIRGISKRHLLSAGANIPDNPSLPTAPTMNGAVLQATIAKSLRRPGGSGGKKSSNLPLILGAGALALMFMRGRK